MPNGIIKILISIKMADNKTSIKVEITTEGKQKIDQYIQAFDNLRDSVNNLAKPFFGLYFSEKRRIAHVGFIEKWTKQTITTVEGNTNQAGSREGDGVYRKIRLTRQIYAVTRFIK